MASIWPGRNPAPGPTIRRRRSVARSSTFVVSTAPAYPHRATRPDPGDRLLARRLGSRSPALRSVDAQSVATPTAASAVTSGPGPTRLHQSGRGAGRTCEALAHGSVVSHRAGALE